jgi:hypothetical protein
VSGQVGVELQPGVMLGRRDLDEAREEQWNGSHRRGGAGLGVAEGGAVLDRLGVAEGIVEVRGEAEAGGRGGCTRVEAKVSKSRCGGRAAGTRVGSGGGGCASRGTRRGSESSEREREAGHVAFFWIRQ